MKNSRRIEIVEKIEQLIEDGVLIKRWDEKKRIYVYEPTEFGKKLHAVLMEFEA